MGKVSFSNNNDGTAVAEPQVSAPAEAAEESPGVPATVPQDQTPALYQDDDNIPMSEIILPRINIVQGIGGLSETFERGEIVLNKDLVIYQPKGEDDKNHESLDITVVGFRPTQWTEKIEGGVLGRLCSSPAEVYALGGTTDYNKAQAAKKAKKDLPYFEPLATALILIRKPSFVDAEDVNFTDVFGEHRYTLALWSMKGGAFTHGAKVIKTARKIRHLKGGYATYSWKLDTTLKKYEGNRSSNIPVLKPGDKHGPEFAAFLTQCLGGASEDSSAE